MGKRMKAVEEGCASEKGRTDRMERELDNYRRDTVETHGRLGKVEEALHGVNDHLTEMKLEIAGGIADLKQTVTEQNALMRERMMRVETINEVERKIGRKIGDD